MVVTCPSCSARYRLNPNKMKGRGAKITCPKCAHLFVVFADGASGSASEDTGDSSASLLRSEDTLRERLARRDLSTTNSALKAIGLGDDVGSGQTSSKIRVVAPGPRGSRKPVATLDTNQSLTTIDSGGAGEPGVYSGPEILSADQLNFREVGIATWKVKVAIGLVYDFSDIATLKRYLGDKRVTPADLLSHDGKEWLVIGDIPNLDSHFIEAWKTAYALRKDAPSPKKKASEGTGTGNLATSTGRMGALSPSGHHQTQRSRPKRKKRAPKKPEKRSGNKSLWVLAAVCLFGGLVYFLTRPPDLREVVGLPAAPAGSVGQASGVDENQAEQDKIRKGVKEEVARQREKMMADEKAAAALVEEESEGAEREAEVDLSKLEAVRPAQQTTALKRSASKAVQRSVPGAQNDRRRAPPSARGTSGATTSVQRDEGGAMWLAEGKKALAAGNYGSATTMFQQCVNKNAASGECWAGLGNSLQRTGNSAEANAAFDRATALGVRVNRSSP